MAKSAGVVLLTSLDPRRLKTPTAFLPFGEGTALERTLAAYKSLAPAEIVVVSAESPDRLRTALGKSVEGVTLVTSPDVRGRMGQGLKLGIERLSSRPDIIVIGLGDQPLLNPDLMKDLRSRFEAADGGIGVAVCQGTPGHPVFFASSYFTELTQMRPEETHRALLIRHPDDVVDLTTEETAVLRTIDNPESYRELLAIAGLPAPPAPVFVEPPKALPREPEPEPEPETGDEAHVPSGDEAHVPSDAEAAPHES
jgi:molybdenum cofactor cytidylyltransferase